MMMWLGVMRVLKPFFIEELGGVRVYNETSLCWCMIQRL